jgi:predicted transcriptional regulator
MTNPRRTYGVPHLGCGRTVRAEVQWPGLVSWAAGGPLRVREVADELNQNRPLAFNTVQTVMENLFRKGWLNRQKSGRAYWYVTVRSREDYVAGLLGEALAVAQDPAATLVRLVEDLEPREIAQLRVALDAAAERESRQ